MTNYNNLSEQTKEIESLISSDLPKGAVEFNKEQYKLVGQVKKEYDYGKYRYLTLTLYSTGNACVTKNVSGRRFYFSKATDAFAYCKQASNGYTALDKILG